MTSKTDQVFYILRQGAVQDEPWEWGDIEEACRDGRLTPETLIFVTEDDSWSTLGETELAGLFGQKAPARQTEAPAATAEEPEEYRDVLAQLEASPNDWNLLTQAGQMAQTIGDTDTAVQHFQRALEIRPYHPRIVQEIKRSLSPADQKKLRFVAKAAPFWEDPRALLTYPLERGPVYPLVAAAAVAALSWIPWVSQIAPLVLYLWMMQVIAASGRGEARPPLWDGLAGNIGTSVIKPLVVGLVVGVMIYGPFLAIAKLLMLVGMAKPISLMSAVQKSPLMIVPVFTLSLIYLPAVFALAPTREMSLGYLLKPKNVIQSIGRMGVEYVATVIFVLGTTTVWGAVRLILGGVPVLGHIVVAALGVYTLLLCGFALGRLYARFQEELAD